MAIQILLLMLTLATGIEAQVGCLLPEEIVFLGIDSQPVPETKFLLYTNNNSYYPQELYSEDSIKQSNYDPKLKTVIVVPGYGADAYLNTLHIRTAYLLYEKCNVIVVDWQKGSSTVYFPNAIRNAYLVGKYTANGIETLKRVTGAILDNFHVIGWSLGGQTAAFICKGINTGKIGRLTALDPAGLCFVDYSPKHKLHSSDAKFVEVITTTTASIAGAALLSVPTGDVHFKPDGGNIGRGCENEDPIEAITCSHFRAVKLFIYSFFERHCLPVAYACPDYKTFESGDCFNCGDGRNCSALGIHAEKYADKVIKNKTTVMYLDTTYVDSLCLFHYHVEVTLYNGPGSVTENGNLFLLINDGEIKAELTEGYTQFEQELKPGTTYTYLVRSSKNVIPIWKVEILWYSPKPRKESKLYFQCVIIIPMNNLQIDRTNLTTIAAGNKEQAVPPNTIIALNIGASC